MGTKFSHRGLVSQTKRVTTSGQYNVPKNQFCSCGSIFTNKTEIYTFEGCDELRCRKCYFKFVDAS